jgi:hypothetical protein
LCFSASEQLTQRVRMDFPKGQGRDIDVDNTCL